MSAFFETHAFCLILCLINYQIGQLAYRYLKLPIFHPLTVSAVLTALAVYWLDIPIDVFQEVGLTFSLFLSATTVCLALPIYRQRRMLKVNLLPILVGTFVGAISSMLSVFFLCKAFLLDEVVTASLLPKSTTTPIAFAISDQLGGVQALTFLALFVAGMTGATFAPLFIRIFRLDKDPVAAGLAIGAASHAMGTTKAVEIGEALGAMSGLAIGFVGFFSVILSLFI